MSNLNTALRLQKPFSKKVEDYFNEATKGLSEHFVLQYTSHYVHRTVDRLNKDQVVLARRMMYHAINNKLGELLFWAMDAESPTSCIIYRKGLAVVVYKKFESERALLVRTVYKTSSKKIATREPNIFVIKL